MIGWLEGLMDFISPKYNYVKTTKGRVGRVESVNTAVHSVTISFGSFDPEGNWTIQRKINISSNNIECYLNKEQMVRELSNINATKLSTHNS